jgi:hypothetical protein
LSSRPERRDLCVDASSWKCFSTEDSWACGPPKVMKKASVRQLLSIEPLPFPLSSRAYPDFLLHSSNQGHLCGSP